ncbi:MAG TPA: CRTAC1 family protein [Candidatus Tectomicrobia bacterium]|nr:CRTAC1 family protein [Candidatus Tectomicrobia bacterium]
MTTRVLLERLAWVAAPAAARPRALAGWVRDPRTPFAAILTVYAVLGCTVLTFSRGPLEIGTTVLAGCLLDMGLHWLLRERALIVPLSAYISSLSLALLLNYAHDSWLLFLPVFLTVGSKYLLTYEGRHVFNPSMCGITLSLLLGGDLITAAPAYQWGGGVAMSAFIVTAALVLFVFRIGRTPLIVSFLAFYLLQIGLRAWVMRWYLPPEALLLGTLTSAPFFLFVFFMITDPKTSPASPRAQVLTALALVTVDLGLHALSHLYTFFYAAFVVALARFTFLHARRLVRQGPVVWLREGLLHPRMLRTAAVLAAIALATLGGHHLVRPAVAATAPAFALERLGPGHTGIDARLGGVWEDVDVRVRHIAKWLLSAGSAVAVADVDEDGLLDVFVTNPLMRPEDRNRLYRNRGDLRFEPVPIPALAAVNADAAAHGVAGMAVFADHDNDGDQDLFLAVGYGRNVLLRNMLAETGTLRFEAVTAAAGLDDHAVSIAATFLDYDRDGRLDLVVGNAFATHLAAYDPPREFSIFRLPRPEHPGDRRMLGFMHASWDNARNGGGKALYRNLGHGRFARQDVAAMGMPETHWTLAVAAGDLNNDGWPDLYAANDFGPDDLYLNEGGARFHRIAGGRFGTVGRDTYKGMNASLGDVDRNGWLDVYVSNVHVPLQAEGSLLWMTYPDARDPRVPRFRDEAARRGALNERRFGWGAALGDLDHDGWLDIVQANGMVDDRIDRRFERCPSYWYVNEKLMRSGPEIHTYADLWGDLRGYCIFGIEANRVYLSQGDASYLQFADVAPQLGWKAETNSRGVALADLDNDGTLDVLISHQFEPLSVYRNRRAATEPPRHWIGFQARGNGRTCNRDAAGTRVRIAYDEAGRRVEQMREIAIVNGLSAQSDRRAHFGVGGHAGAVSVSVSWCGGPSVDLGPFAVDRYHVLAQP